VKRRSFGLLWLLASLGPWPMALRAQPQDAVARVGVLRPSAPPLSSDGLQITGLPRALAERGYVVGRNLQIETRYAGGDAARLPALALELLQARVHVIVAVSAPAVRAVLQAAPSMPVVMFGNFDPVGLGVVTSLARPGGNVTGVLIAPDGTLAGKRLELLKSAVPQARRVAFLVPPADTTLQPQLQETRSAAAALGLELHETEVRDGDYAKAFQAMAARRPQALIVGAHTLFVRDRAAIIALAAQYKLPAIYEWRDQVLDGGLMAYSTSLYGLYQRLAEYVDRILKGAKPGELPIERPSTFELVINMKTARALGLTIPQSLLLRADEVIE
jgi:putative tryptophan/tyrosine transport system substrate-binding protein